MLLRAVKREVNPAITRPRRNMYAQLRVCFRISLNQGEMARSRDRTIPVKKGAKQGAVASPCYFNSNILKAQDQCKMSCILSG